MKFYMYVKIGVGIVGRKAMAHVIVGVWIAIEPFAIAIVIANNVLTTKIFVHVKRRKSHNETHII